MKQALRKIKSATVESLRSEFRDLRDWKQANQLLKQRSGIQTFFDKEDQFFLFLDILKPHTVVSEPIIRREYGDYQTPAYLSDLACNLLFAKGVSPQVVVEPTFGIGSFILSAIKIFPNLEHIYGVEIYEPYCWHSKFSVLEYFYENPTVRKPELFLYCDDVFRFDFETIGSKEKAKRILVLGNPPWVTSAELSTLNSKNIPNKSNFKSFNGLDAITGKGNFDIGEYIILSMLNSFAKHNGSLAMLAKNSVIRNLILDLPKTNYPIHNLVSFGIDAKLAFGASVEASLFTCNFQAHSPQYSCAVSLLDAPSNTEKRFGWVGNKFVSDINLYDASKRFDGVCPFVWRQGVKHDCSRILELELNDRKLVNGFKDTLDIEDDLVFGLVKSSDLQAALITIPRKRIIITQKKVGEDTSYIAQQFPKLYRYLSENMMLFNERKSVIYNGKTPFSIFGIGDYSFKPYKISISGLYKRPSFSLVPPFNSKPVMLDDTCYFLGFDDLAESLATLALLNSELTLKLLQAITFLDSKRPYTKDVLMRVDLFTIANQLSFQQITDFLGQLPTEFSISYPEEKWDAFRSKLEPHDKTKSQQSLFAPAIG